MYKQTRAKEYVAIATSPKPSDARKRAAIVKEVVSSGTVAVAAWMRDVSQELTGRNGNYATMDEIVRLVADSLAVTPMDGVQLLEKAMEALVMHSPAAYHFAGLAATFARKEAV